LRDIVFHVVAQVVEAQFVVRRVGDVAGIGRAALVVVEAVNDDARGQAEETVNTAHPLGVAAGEVVVDGDDMHAPAGQRIEIDRERGDKRLAFAGLHFRDGALMLHHAADELHVERAQAQNAL
jgi:hypothetical protein